MHWCSDGGCFLWCPGKSHTCEEYSTLQHIVNQNVDFLSLVQLLNKSLSVLTHQPSDARQYDAFPRWTNTSLLLMDNIHREFIHELGGKWPSLVVWNLSSVSSNELYRVHPLIALWSYDLFRPNLLWKDSSKRQQWLLHRLVIWPMHQDSWCPQAS